MTPTPLPEIKITVKHVVEPGENLSAICLRENMSIGVVLELNPSLATPDLIFPGDKFVIHREVLTPKILGTKKKDKLTP